jgi:hypothetical protein
MQNYFEGMADESRRQHPWTVSSRNSELKYYDFKKQPELVSEVLEDFKAWEHYEAVQHFYDMIRWLNGPNSNLETSDCGFRGPRENDQRAQWPKELVCNGGLFVFFRNVQFNLSDESKEWSKEYLAGQSPKLYKPSKYLKWLIDSSLELITQINRQYKWACISVGLRSIVFVEAPVPEDEQLGYQIVYRFWAWGDSEQEVMEKFKYVVDTLLRCFTQLSGEVTK